MQLSAPASPEAKPISQLFQTAFTDAANAEEGTLVAGLVTALLAAPAKAHVQVFTAQQDQILTGCILFSPLHYAQDKRRVALLSPVAVHPDWQGKGVGSALIRFGLEQLRLGGTEIAVTYGDPAYYGRFGFRQVTAQELPPPHPLSQPAGWQAMTTADTSTDAASFAPLQGPCTCLQPFDDPALW